MRAVTGGAAAGGDATRSSKSACVVIESQWAMFGNAITWSACAGVAEVDLGGRPQARLGEIDPAARERGRRRRRVRGDDDELDVQERVARGIDRGLAHDGAEHRSRRVERDVSDVGRSPVDDRAGELRRHERAVEPQLRCGEVEPRPRANHDVGLEARRLRRCDGLRSPATRAPRSRARA